jgi:hypothetical protein
MASLFCATLLGQLAAPTIQPQTFHIHGMVRNTIDNSVVAGVKVTFEAEKGSKIVSTDRRGIHRGRRFAYQRMRLSKSASVLS